MTATTETASPRPADPFAVPAGQAAVHAAVIAAVRAAFADELIETIAFRGETTLVVRRDRILDILVSLRDDSVTQLDRLSDLTAVDYLALDHEPRFAVVYHLMSRSNLARLRIRAQVPEDDPVIASCTGLFPAANWLEREVFDMMGITFAGHPDLKRILMPDDWEGFPLRKDFPVGAEEVQFSFNVEEIDRQYPQTLREREERYRVNHPVNNW